MQLSMKGFTEDEAQKKRAECIVRLRIRENDVKSQMWRLMTDNSFESVTSVEGEVSKIFEDLDSMIVELFDAIQGIRTKKIEDDPAKGNNDNKVETSDQIEEEPEGETSKRLF